MSEPVSLTLGAVVSALVVKAAEKASETTVDAGAGVLGRIVTAVRGRFTRDDDTEAQQALDVAQMAPDSQMAIDRLATAIDAHAVDHETWAHQLQRLVEQAQASDDIDVDQAVQQIHGDHNFALQNVHGSTISINQPPTGG